MDKNTIQLDFENGNNDEYKVEEIWDSVVYVKEIKYYLPGFYYLVL